MQLVYRDTPHVEDLAQNECVIRWCAHGGKRWLMLWFYVARDSDGVLEDFAVPINVGGDYQANGPGGRTWGFKKVGPNTWQVSPSIDVKEDTRDAHPGGAHDAPSAWHQTPTIMGVPDPEPWTRLDTKRAS